MICDAAWRTCGEFVRNRGVARVEHVVDMRGVGTHDEVAALRCALAARAAGWGLYEGPHHVAGLAPETLELIGRPGAVVLRSAEGGRIWRIVGWEERGGELRMQVRGAFGRADSVVRVRRDGAGTTLWGPDWFEEGVVRELERWGTPSLKRREGRLTGSVHDGRTSIASVVAIAPDATIRVDDALAAALVAQARVQERTGRPREVLVFSAPPTSRAIAERLAWLAPSSLRLFDLTAPGVEVRPHDQGDLLVSAPIRLRTRLRPPPAVPPHVFYRRQPERWLASLVADNPTLVDPVLDARHVYEQVPARRRGSRERADLLAVTKSGRLAVLELKVSEDRALPLQGLDYWARVRWHHSRGDIARLGYFPGIALDPRPPLLYLVAPLFRLHASVGVVTNLFRPEVETIVVGLRSDWRKGPRALARWISNQ